ncbi:hypothetical protein Tco_0222132 [Tanacetum coccineum]
MKWRTWSRVELVLALSLTNLIRASGVGGEENALLVSTGSSESSEEVGVLQNGSQDMQLIQKLRDDQKRMKKVFEVMSGRNIVTNSRVTPSWREIVSLTFSEAGVLHVNWTSFGHCVILEANLLLILIILKTFECLWLHTLHAKPRENEFESFSGQCLSEYIRQLILCPHEIQLNHSLFHLFSDEMMSDVDVFRPGVLDVVVAESYGTLVVTIQRDVIVCKAII